MDKQWVSRIRGKARGAGAAALALALAGCISLGGKAPPTLLDLTPAAVAPAGALGSGRVAEAIVVMEPDTDHRLSVPRVPVQIDAANVAYLKDAQWVEKPARLFRNLLAETIRSKGERLVFEDDGTMAGGRLRLSGRLVDMGYDAQTRSAVVRFDAVRDKDGQVDTRRFESVVPGVKPKAGEVGAALNRASNDVARQVADWVG